MLFLCVVSHGVLKTRVLPPDPPPLRTLPPPHSTPPPPPPPPPPPHQHTLISDEGLCSKRRICLYRLGSE